MISLEVKDHTVPHWKALSSGKYEQKWLRCGSTLTICQDALKSANKFILHKRGFVDSQMKSTVSWMNMKKLPWKPWKKVNQRHRQVDLQCCFVSFQHFLQQVLVQFRLWSFKTSHFFFLKSSSNFYHHFLLGKNHSSCLTFKSQMYKWEVGKWSKFAIFVHV